MVEPEENIVARNINSKAGKKRGEKEKQFLYHLRWSEISFIFFSFDTNFCSTWIQCSHTTPSKNPRPRFLAYFLVISIPSKNEQKIPLSITLSPFSSVLESNLTQPTIQNCFHYQCHSTSTDSGLYCTCFTSYHWAIHVYCVHSIICDYVSPFSQLSCVISTSSFQFIAVPFLSILSSIHCKMQMWWW